MLVRMCGEKADENITIVRKMKSNEMDENDDEKVWKEGGREDGERERERDVCRIKLVM